MTKAELDALKSRLASLKLRAIQRERVPPAGQPPKSFEMDAKGGLREDGGMISGSAGSTLPNGVFTGYALGTDLYTVYKVSARGDGPGGRFNQIIGPQRDAAFDYFIPYVQDGFTGDENPYLYPVGLTRAQFFELEWRTKTITLAGVVSSDDGSAGGSIATENLWGSYLGQGQDQTTTIPDERYILRRAGYRQGVVSIASLDVNDAGLLRRTDMFADVAIGACDVSGVFPYSSRAPVRFPTAYMQRLTAGGGEGGVYRNPRVVYSGGLYYPCIYIGVRGTITTDDPEVPGNAIYRANVNLFGFGSGELASIPWIPDDYFTISGVGPPAWSVNIPAYTTGSFGPGSYSVALGAFGLSLSSWPFA